MKINKLVRDKIPELIKQDGKNPITRKMDESEFKEKLYSKLLEEFEEYLNNRKLEELADIYEVMIAIVNLEGFSVEELEQKRLEKREKKGAFEKHIFLQSIED